MRACVRLIVPRLCSRHTCPTSKPGGSMTRSHAPRLSRGARFTRREPGHGGTRASPPRAWPRAASGGRASLVWRVGRVIASGQQRGGVSEEVFGEGGEQSDARDVREAAHEHLSNPVVALEVRQLAERGAPSIASPPTRCPPSGKSDTG